MRVPLGFWEMAVGFPRLLQAGSLHRAGLAAAAATRYELADRLFEAAAARYREDLRVPALARLRVHQLMVRAEAGSTRDHDAALESSGEIERRLLALDTLEDLDPPFAEVRARELFARWSARFSRVQSARAA